ncbi:serine/threonine protein kinase [Mycolicibacterium canariasense]|uniref:non-specific serine/threonine protein kinase n=1 Tax=Mycolicibacterium canariasense TaxID=228230 RepID=A0A100WCP6_MYCCR|nr:serine/threonine-protein kinase [Mycolicibacterium canariasense]MCV7212546.1 serine/threonine protein kinase [Mycolicibacterium canariasense]ORV05388.1 protein kinase [Mycolicibacterium canariasense]GAS95593.1 serine/threonine protein kinase [Mycolicibacterium canariasense]
MNIRVGARFGPYELRTLLGVGGMGEVYQAFDTVKGRLVALKLLRPELAADPSFQERFRRESRIAAQLHEPHIIPVHDFGDIDGVLFIDMRLVSGLDLKSVLVQQGPLHPGRAVAVLSQIAAALDAAHAAGLTHRDVKPENVLLTADDFAYLVDFGIARSGTDSGLTTAGSAIGSCAYMAPERFTDGYVGPPTDVYSLACLLYELLTGTPPFPAGDIAMLMNAHLFSPPPRPSMVRPGVSPAFDDVVAWGMAKDPAHRCPSAGGLARAAAAAAVAVQTTPSAPTVLDGKASGTVSRTTRSSRPLLLGALGLVVLVVAAGAAAWLILGGDDTTTAVPTTVTRTALPAPTTATSHSAVLTTTSAVAPRASLPGTDVLGFLAYPGARCDPAQVPVALGLTAQSAVVICQSPAGALVYRGVRLNDNAGIELGDAVHVPGGGFDITNPTDGTQYQVRDTALTIIGSDGTVHTEPMEQYASTF